MIVFSQDKSKTNQIFEKKFFLESIDKMDVTRGKMKQKSKYSLGYEKQLYDNIYYSNCIFNVIILSLYKDIVKLNCNNILIFYHLYFINLKKNLAKKEKKK